MLATMGAVAPAADDPARSAGDEDRARARLSPSQELQVEQRLRPGYEPCLKTARSTLSAVHCNMAEITWQQARLDREVVVMRAGLASPVARIAFDKAQNQWKDGTIQTCGAIGRRRGSIWAVEAQICFLNQTVMRQIALEGGTP